jgi:quinol monooxygenase YgiN
MRQHDILAPFIILLHLLVVWLGLQIYLFSLFEVLISIAVLVAIFYNALWHISHIREASVKSIRTSGMFAILSFCLSLNIAGALIAVIIKPSFIETCLLAILPGTLGALTLFYAEQKRIIHTLVFTAFLYLILNFYMASQGDIAVGSQLVPTHITALHFASWSLILPLTFTAGLVYAYTSSTSIELIFKSSIGFVLAYLLMPHTIEISSYVLIFLWIVQLTTIHFWHTSLFGRWFTQRTSQKLTQTDFDAYLHAVKHTILKTHKHTGTIEFSVHTIPTNHWLAPARFYVTYRNKENGYVNHLDSESFAKFIDGNTLWHKGRYEYEGPLYTSAHEFLQLQKELP